MHACRHAWHGTAGRSWQTWWLQPRRRRPSLSRPVSQYGAPFQVGNHRKAREIFRSLGVPIKQLSHRPDPFCQLRDFSRCESNKHYADWRVWSRPIVTTPQAFIICRASRGSLKPNRINELWQKASGETRETRRVVFCHWLRLSDPGAVTAMRVE